MKYYGRLFYFCRFLIRCFHTRYRIDHPERLKDPVVYLSRHFNSKGIFMTIPWLPDRIRIWALSVYHDRRVCFDHLVQYTLTERYGFPKWKAKMMATLYAPFLSALMRSSRTIPVYRDSMKVIQTYQLSLKALKQGESLLIFPERSYTSEDGRMSDMYEGFLLIDRLYFRDTGRHIPFVTIFADAKTATIKVREPILFQGDARDPDERKRVCELIQSQLSDPTDQDDQSHGS